MTLLPATTTATMAEEADAGDNAAMESIAQDLLEVRITRRRLSTRVVPEETDVAGRSTSGEETGGEVERRSATRSGG